MKMSNTEKVIVFIVCIAISVLVVFGALVKLEHWSEQTHKILSASGSFLAALLMLYIFLKARYAKKDK